jgi:hypothetical protein
MSKEMYTPKIGDECFIEHIKSTCQVIAIGDLMALVVLDGQEISCRIRELSQIKIDDNKKYQVTKIIDRLMFAGLSPVYIKHANYLYDNGARIIGEDQRVVTPLSDKQLLDESRNKNRRLYPAQFKDHWNA